MERHAVCMTFNGTDFNFKMDMGDFNLVKVMPKIKAIPPYGQNWSWSGGGPKLGLSVQDTDDGKGVKVIEVDDESNAAKAGIKEDDVITEVDGKAVNSADEIAKIVKESKDKVSIMVKLQRGGKSQNIELKMPRKIKTADLRSVKDSFLLCMKSPVPVFAGALKLFLKDIRYSAKWSIFAASKS